MFSKHYEGELAFLRETGREFGLRHPALAESLTEKGQDPDVERLLEGFAFLAARIRERTSAAQPELIEPLAELLAPHTLRGVPAATILHLQPRGALLRAKHEVAAGTLFGSRTIEGVSCPFATSTSVSLSALSVERCHLDETRAAHPELVITMRLPERAFASTFDAQPVRLHLHGTHAMASTLLLWFARHLERATVRIGGRDFDLDRKATLPAVEGTMGDLWPWPDTSPLGPRAITEFFTFPERFHFVDLTGWERIPTEALAEQIELRLRFSKPPSLPEPVPEDAIRLHCVPAINVWRTDAEPIRRKPFRDRYLLRAAGRAPAHAEVFSVERVIGRRSRHRGEVRYAARSLFDARRDDEAFVLARERSPLDGRLDTHLWLCSPEALATSEETISVEMTCTSRGLPTLLRAGDIGNPLPESPTMVVARNIGRVSPGIPSTHGQELQWRLLGHFAQRHRSLAHPGALRTHLSEFNVPENIDVHAARGNAIRISGVRSVTSAPERRAFRGAVVRGVGTRVELDEDAFRGVGDAFLFGCALDRLLGAEIPLQTFSALSISLTPSRTELTWTPRTGTRALI